MRELQKEMVKSCGILLRTCHAVCQAVGRDALGLAREVMSGNGQASGEVNALQRIAAAASEPLLALGRSAGAVIFSGLGSTTAVALTSSLGILRLGFGEHLLPRFTHGLVVWCMRLQGEVARNHCFRWCRTS